MTPLGVTIRKVEMDEERKHQIWLNNASAMNRNRAYRRAAYEPKNLASTGHPSLITEVDPNPKVISNAPKERFSKPQRQYLMDTYVHHTVCGEMYSTEAYDALEMRSTLRDDWKAGEKVQSRKASTRSAKRSAKNLAEYGYVVLSYDDMNDDMGEMMYNPNVHQPVLIVTATMAAIEKGREFWEQDGYSTDPETLRRWHSFLK